LPGLDWEITDVTVGPLTAVLPLLDQAVIFQYKKWNQCVSLQL